MQKQWSDDVKDKGSDGKRYFREKMNIVGLNLSPSFNVYGLKGEQIQTFWCKKALTRFQEPREFSRHGK